MFHRTRLLQARHNALKLRHMTSCIRHIRAAGKGREDGDWGRGGGSGSGVSFVG